MQKSEDNMFPKEQYLQEIVPALATDPMIKDLMEFTGLTEAEIRTKADGAMERMQEEWRKADPEITEKSVADIYRNTASGYIYTWAYADRFRYSKYHGLRPFLRGKKLLDYGTAAGCMSLFAAKLDGMDVTSADLDTPYFALAKYRFNKYGVCTPLNLDQEQLPESAFDTVLLLDVLEHVVNWQKTLTDVTAALKNGGRLIVIVAYDLYPDGSLHICDRTGLTPETFTEWMLNHGYQFIEKSGNFSVYDLQKVS